MLIFSASPATSHHHHHQPPILPGHACTTPAARKPTERWLFSVLKTPQTPAQLRALHGQVVKTGNARNDLVLGQLLLCCSISNSMDYALSVFLSLPYPTNPFFYNALLKGYAANGAHDQCLGVYALMRARSVPCDSFTFPVVLRSVARFARLDVGEEVHGLAVKTGLHGEVVVRTAVMDMYFSCGLADHARAVFDGTNEPDSICWNTLIAGHVKCGEFDRACEVFDQMPQRNVSSWNTMLDMYCKIGKVDIARRLFDDMPKRDIISWNSMISGYARMGDSDKVRRLFELMPKRNVVSWNAVLTSYVQNSLFEEALSLFKEMLESNVKPNEVTVVAVLSACAHLGALDLGQWVEAYICKWSIKMDAYVIGALIDMYGKCGSLLHAQRVFDKMSVRDTFLCSTMIEVLAMHGKADEAFDVFDFMRKEAIKPNDVTFVGLLKACSHVGRVETGQKYFDMMSGVFGLTPKVEHYGCMVDLLGRAGRLDEAYKMILTMPMEPHPIVWVSLLSSCRIHGQVKLAEEVALRLIKLEPQSCRNYVLLSNTYSKVNRWEDAALIRNLMKEKGVTKKPGCSLIEVGNRVHEFLAGDHDHPRSKEIYGMLNQMVIRLKREGYVPFIASALQDVGSDRKEQALLYHSEKLALAFGLISTEKGAPIKIFKNLRICDDCHLFMKLVSKHYERQMIVRDCNRFHHFSDGSCSCLDYW